MIIPFDNQLPASLFRGLHPSRRPPYMSVLRTYWGNLEVSRGSRAPDPEMEVQRIGGSCFRIGDGKLTALVKDADGNVIGLIQAP
jgi:hypothetical protein